MNVLVSLEQRFYRTASGEIWSSAGFPYPFWRPYLEVFEEVRVVARIRDMSDIPQNYRRCDGQRVRFIAVPYYIGPWEYLKVWKGIGGATQTAMSQNEAVIMRVPSVIASFMYPALRRDGRPYAVEVVGDPYDVFSPGAVRCAFRPLFRWLFSRRMRNQCAGACGAAYVTREALQRRYSCIGYSIAASDARLPAQAFVASFSSVELAPATYARSPRGGERKERPNLIFVGSLEHMYKGPDVAIEALRRSVRQGMNLGLVLVGDGRQRKKLEAQCVAAGVGDRVSFLGHLPGSEAVRDELDKADLFLQPSRTEGLPRAMIEAMARGLPCIGSNVGGIPELLPPEDLVPPGSAEALAVKIREVVRDSERMARMSARNLATAEEYREEVLRERRVAFYRHVKEQTEAWIRAKVRN